LGAASDGVTEPLASEFTGRSERGTQTASPIHFERSDALQARRSEMTTDRINRLEPDDADGPELLASIIPPAVDETAAGWDKAEQRARTRAFATGIRQQNRRWVGQEDRP
jgi:hypothetical protein